MFAISVDPPKVSEEFRRKLGAEFTFLSDERGELLDRLGIRHHDPFMGDIAFPTAILVDKYGDVRWVYEMQYGHMRMKPEQLFEATERLALEEQNRELTRSRSLAKVVRQVFLMKGPEDLSAAMEVLQEELFALGVRFAFAALIMASDDEQRFRAYVATLAVPAEGPSDEDEEFSLDEHRISDYPEMTDWLEAWKHQRFLMTPSRDDPKQNSFILLLQSYAGLPDSVGIRRLVHVPFSQGTLSVGLRESDRFGDDEFRTVAEFAEAISVAYSRFQDFEELGRSNRELKQAQTQLIQSEKMASLGQLVAGVAHELNTPIGAIHGNTQSSTSALERMAAMLDDASVLSEVDTRKIGKMVHALKDMNRVNRAAGDRVIHIVNNLRKFARLDESEWKRADLREGLDETLMLLAHKTRDRIEVQTKYSPVPQVACYPGQLNQVFMNLIVNAIQAIDDKGTITIELLRQGDQAVVRVQDTGSGIEPEKLSKIFDPGFTTKGVGVGTGLGLSIVYGIVETHHGSLDVESELGKGTIFTLKVPIDGEPAT